MRNVYVFLCLNIFTHFLNGQQNDTSCTFQVRKHSFEKGVIITLRMLTIFNETEIYSNDTLIGDKVFFKRTVTSNPNHDYWHEAENGEIWKYYPIYYPQAVVFIPDKPFVGYKVKNDRMEMTIVSINETKTFGSDRFGEVTFDNLIVCEETDLIRDRTWKVYFKKGVGWVALESDSCTTYVECIKYPAGTPTSKQK